MNRLTINNRLKDSRESLQPPKVETAIRKLAKYENTELTPEEILALKETIAINKQGYEEEILALKAENEALKAKLPRIGYDNGNGVDIPIAYIAVTVGKEIYVLKEFKGKNAKQEAEKALEGKL